MGYKEECYTGIDGMILVLDKFIRTGKWPKKPPKEFITCQANESTGEVKDAPEDYRNQAWKDLTEVVANSKVKAAKCLSDLRKWSAGE